MMMKSGKNFPRNIRAIGLGVFLISVLLFLTATIYISPTSSSSDLSSRTHVAFVSAEKKLDDDVMNSDDDETNLSLPAPLSQEIMNRLNMAMNEWNRHPLSSSLQLNTFNRDRGCKVFYETSSPSSNSNNSTKETKGGGGEGGEDGTKQYDVAVRCDELESLVLQIVVNENAAGEPKKLLSVSEPVSASHSSELFSLIYVAPQAPSAGAQGSIDTATEALLHSLSEQTDTGYELIIISTHVDPETIIVKAQELGVRLAAVIPATEGPRANPVDDDRIGQAVNLGVAFAVGKWLAFIRGDVELTVPASYIQKSRALYSQLNPKTLLNFPKAKNPKAQGSVSPASRCVSCGYGGRYDLEGAWIPWGLVSEVRNMALIGSPRTHTAMVKIAKANGYTLNYDQSLTLYRSYSQQKNFDLRRPRDRSSSGSRVWPTVFDLNERVRPLVTHMLRSLPLEPSDFRQDKSSSLQSTENDQQVRSIVENKFTVLMNGFSPNRIPMMKQLISSYVESPYVAAVVILWGNIDTKPPTPADLMSNPRVPIVVIKQNTSSLNERFLPRPDVFTTRAVFICDDDIFLSIDDLHFAFDVWNTNQQRIVGFFSRAHVNKGRGWTYSRFTDRYSMILTKAMFIDTSYFEEYTNGMPSELHEYIDQGRNCEDILMNFVVSMKTGMGPIMVRGESQIKDLGDGRNEEVSGFHNDGISNERGHRTKRDDCLQTFESHLGGMHLVYTRFVASRESVLEDVRCKKHGYWVHCDQRVRNEQEAKKYSQSSQNSGGPRFAYATFITNISLVPAAIVHAQSLLATGTDHDLVLMVDENQDDLYKHKVLANFYDSIVKVPGVPNPYGVNRYGKLAVWTLTEYDKVVYIDVDTLVLQNIDDLFLRPELAAVPDIYSTDKFSSGLMVLQPNLQRHSDLVKKAEHLVSYNKGDQGFLNAFFDNWFAQSSDHRLPMSYNTLLFFPTSYNPPKWFDREQLPELLGEQVKVMHYANPWFKPWNSKNRTVSRWIDLWWKFNDAIKANNQQPLGPSEIIKLRTSDALLQEPQHKHSERPPRVSAPLTKEPVLEDDQKEALVTLVDSDEMALAAAAWAESYKTTHASSVYRKLIALVASSMDVKNPLLQGFDEVIAVKPFAELGDKADKSFLVLHVWNLTAYRKVVFVDVLSLFVESITILFTDYEAFGAVPAVYPTDRFSADVMVIEPSSSTLTDMLAQASEWLVKGSWDYSAEAFLNEYFWDWYQSPAKHRLPIGFHTDFYFKSGMTHYFKPYRIIHFDRRAKPWASPTAFNNYERKQFLRMWYTSLCRVKIGVPAEEQTKCLKYNSLPQRAVL